MKSEDLKTEEFEPQPQMIPQAAILKEKQEIKYTTSKPNPSSVVDKLKSVVKRQVKSNKRSFVTNGNREMLTSQRDSRFHKKNSPMSALKAK